MKKDVVLTRIDETIVLFFKPSHVLVNKWTKIVFIIEKLVLRPSADEVHQEWNDINGYFFNTKCHHFEEM